MQRSISQTHEHIQMGSMSLLFLQHLLKSTNEAQIYIVLVSVTIFASIIQDSSLQFFLKLE